MRTASGAVLSAAVLPTIHSGPVVPGVVHKAPHWVDETGGVDWHIEVVCLLWIQGVVLALQHKS